MNPEIPSEDALTPLQNVLPGKGNGEIAAVPRLDNSTASALDDPARPEYWYWWLKTTWKVHRRTVAEVHQLLAALQDARGTSFMTVEHVCEVLDAKDPDTLVQEWIGAAPPSRGRRLGLPARSCAWTEDGETCQEPVRAANAKFCGLHAKASKRASNRRGRQIKERKSGRSLALDNNGSMEGRTALAGIMGRRRKSNRAKDAKRP